MRTSYASNRPVHSVGRPSAITPEVVAKLIEAFKLDVTVEEACLYAGISKDTYYRKVKEDEGFSDEMEQARQYATLLARQSVIREIEKDGVLALKYLERKRKEEFSPRAEHQISGCSLMEILGKFQEGRETVDWDKVPVSTDHITQLL